MLRTVALLLIALTACGDSYPPANPPPGALHTPADFAGVGDTQQRSRAIFTEASRVMLSPRCTNCHPAGDTPLQGENALAHDPPVLRGNDDQGIPGLRCTGCHQDKN